MPRRKIHDVLKMVPSGRLMVPHLGKTVPERGEAGPVHPRKLACVAKAVNYLHGDAGCEGLLEQAQELRYGLRVRGASDGADFVRDDRLARQQGSA